jgi:hypothetical protein
MRSVASFPSPHSFATPLAPTGAPSRRLASAASAPHAPVQALRLKMCATLKDQHFESMRTRTRRPSSRAQWPVGCFSPHSRLLRTGRKARPARSSASAYRVGCGLLVNLYCPYLLVPSPPPRPTAVVLPGPGFHPAPAPRPSRCDLFVSEAMLHFGGKAQASQSRAAFFVVFRHRRRTHPPARPSSRAQWPVGYPDRPPATGPGARVCGCGCSRCAWWCLVRICGSTQSYEQRPRDSCSCHWGGRQLSSTPSGVCCGKKAENYFTSQTQQLYEAL